ncbi:MAG: hypothetical protein ABJA81_00525 [Nocardioidaceae bacterium]
MRRPHSLGFVVAAVAVVLVTSSCGGSSNADPAPASAKKSQTPSSETTATKDPAPPAPHFAGTFAVVKTVQKIPGWATDSKVGDKAPRKWVVKPDCREGSCNGTIISSNPDEKGHTSYDYAWSKGKITFGSMIPKTSCGKGFGTYKRVTTYFMKPSAVADDGTITELTGRSTEVIKRDSPGSQCFEGIIGLAISAMAR